MSVSFLYYCVTLQAKVHQHFYVSLMKDGIYYMFVRQAKFRLTFAYTILKQNASLNFCVVFSVLVLKL